MSSENRFRAGGVSDWFFRDRRDGRIVIAQWPNLPLWLFAITASLAWGLDATALTVPAGTHSALRLVALLCLGWWALDELFRGVNPWRRCLGGAVLLLGLWSLLARA